jgi:hypothetical protein
MGSRERDVIVLMLGLIDADQLEHLRVVDGGGKTDWR